MIFFVIIGLLLLGHPLLSMALFFMWSVQYDG